MNFGGASAWGDCRMLGGPRIPPSPWLSGLLFLSSSSTSAFPHVFPWPLPGALSVGDLLLSKILLMPRDKPTHLWSSNLWPRRQRIPRSQGECSLVAQMVKNLPAMWETWVQSLGQEDPLEEGTATHSSILAWRIPWTEEPGGLQSWGRKESDRTKQLTLWLSCDLSLRHFNNAVNQSLEFHVLSFYFIHKWKEMVPKLEKYLAQE